MDMEELRQQGISLCNEKRYGEAEQNFKSYLAAHPDQAMAHYNLGVVLVKQQRFKEAVDCFTEALRKDPGLYQGYTNLGFCLHELGIVKAAQRAFALAHHINPEDPMPIVNEGLLQLTLGEFTDGWKNFEARWSRPEVKFRQRSFHQPIWHGEDIRGKVVLLHAEEGFGDVIHMSRYAPLLEGLGAQVILEVQPALTKLLKSLSPTILVVEQGKPTPAFDYHIPMLSVPIGFQTTLENIPRNIPYLTATADDLACCTKEWPILNSSHHKRVGLAWAGRPTYQRDHFRTIPLSELTPLLELSSICWINLQHPLSAKDQELFQFKGGHVKQPVGFRDFAETAAIIMNLDLVITVDTAVAHLAGALGKPVWLLISYVADWRWMLERQDTPWYPTMRLFRQKIPGDWQSVLQPMVQELNNIKPIS